MAIPDPSDLLTLIEQHLPHDHVEYGTVQMNLELLSRRLQQLNGHIEADFQAMTDLVDLLGICHDSLGQENPLKAQFMTYHQHHYQQLTEAYRQYPQQKRLFPTRLQWAMAPLKSGQVSDNLSDH